MLEAAAGHPDAARELFMRGASLQPPHTPLVASWLAFERAAGNEKAVQRLRQRLAKLERMRRNENRTAANKIETNKRRLSG